MEEPQLQNHRLSLRFFTVEDAEALLRLHRKNQEFFRKYSSTRAPDFYTLDAQRSAIIREERGRDEGSRYSFGIFLKETGELIGGVALTEVVRGALQSCFIGYFLDREQNGKGYTTEAVNLALRFAFGELKLHRVEAGVMPHNLASMRVLEKCGFQKEGIARKCVEIDGAWQDHQILATLADEFHPE
ncbi:MAG TPA: GNAT family protein [Spirochaetia bacterium]|nr:GNAT family protein [Spirochaetia bacterium]